MSRSSIQTLALNGSFVYGHAFGSGDDAGASPACGT